MAIQRFCSEYQGWCIFQQNVSDILAVVYAGNRKRTEFFSGMTYEAIRLPLLEARVSFHEAFSIVTLLQYCNNPKYFEKEESK